MHLAQRLTMLRHARDIRQKEFALYLRLSVSTISNYEKGVHQPDLDTLCRLADFYGVSTDYLLGRVSHSAPMPCPCGNDGLIDLRERIFQKTANLSQENLHTLEWIVGLLKYHDVSVKPVNGYTKPLKPQG